MAITAAHPTDQHVPRRAERADVVEIELVERGPVDALMIAVVCALVAIGLLCVYSGSALKSYFLSSNADDTIYLMRQASGAVAGLVAMVVASRIDYSVYQKLAYPLLIAAWVLLLGTLVPGVGVEVNGASRWVALGPIRFQPGELAKIAAVIYLAYSISKKGEHIRRFLESFVGHGVVFAAMVVLLLQQPDLGTSVVLFAMLGLMLFVGGARMEFLVGLAGLLLVGGYWAITTAEYRMDRVNAWLDPWSNASDTGYQLVNSYIALASGGLTGTGFGQGRGWLGYVPELYNDFVAAAIGEEFGLVGMATLVILYVVFFWRGMVIALRARDRFGYLLAFGLTTLITLQAAINLCVVTGLFPTKGLTLPFVSYGRSSLVLLLFAVGILLNISQQNPDLRREAREAREARVRRDSREMKVRRVDERRRSRARAQVTGHG